MQKIRVTHGEGGGDALPPTGIRTPTIAEARAEAERRSAAEIQADLVVRQLMSAYGTVPSAAWKADFTRALVADREVEVYLHGKVIRLKEHEKMIRDFLRQWPKPAPPMPVDPYDHPTLPHERRELDRLIEAHEDEHRVELKLDAATRERLVGTWRRMNAQGHALSLKSIAQIAKVDL